MSVPIDPHIGLREHRPEPANLWIRHTAVFTGQTEDLWVDLAAGGLGGPSEGGRRQTPNDLVYLPPSSNAEKAEELVQWCDSLGIPTLVHRVAGSPLVPFVGDLSVLAIDPLAALLGGSLGDLERVPDGSIAVWPALAGLTDGEDLTQAGLTRLRASGVRTVVPVALELTPSAGRRLTDAFGEHLFDAVFHAGGVDVRRLARAVHECGLEYMAPRPQIPGAPYPNRTLATLLATIGELSVATSDSPAQAQEFFRAAAWAEETHHDAVALAREGNLAIVPAISERVSAVISEIARGEERPTVLAQLERSYLRIEA
jgi:hypothetical protein